MIKVKLVSYDMLPDEIEKDYLPNNGGGKEYANYILIYHNDDLISYESDAMEPEDAVFYRDLYWIQEAIEQAYELGREDSG